MKKVSKSTLKAKMFEYFDEVESTGQSLIVTDFNEPVLVVVPYSAKKEVSDVFKTWPKEKAKLPKEVLLAPCSQDWPLD